MYYIIGLGNPGEEYENTRHNTGRIAAEELCRLWKIGDFKEDKKSLSLKAEGRIGKSRALCLLPQTFMNKSGSAVKKIITSKEKARKMIVVHDDIDLPLGRFKISYGSGSAGHKGVESVMRAVKTKDFYRVRIGISPSAARNKVKKPSQEKLLDFLMGKFRPSQMKEIKKMSRNAAAALEDIIVPPAFGKKAAKSAKKPRKSNLPRKRKIG